MSPGGQIAGTHPQAPGLLLVLQQCQHTATGDWKNRRQQNPSEDHPQIAESIHQSLLHPPTSSQESKGPGAVRTQWSSQLQPHSADQTHAPTTWTTHQSPSGSYRSSRHPQELRWAHIPEVASFTRHVLPFLSRLLKSKAAQATLMHYSEVCGVSCTGLQTYEDHLEGQKHQKKPAAQMTSTQPSRGPRGVQSLHCGLCAVSFTRADAYATYMRGVRHHNVSKLHTRLGKPIISEPMPQESPTPEA